MYKQTNPWVRITACVLACGLMAVGCGDNGSPGQPCGNGVVGEEETCDDGNSVDGDGCSAACAPERGFTCWETPSICRSSCGDGLVAADEECDDGAYDAGDGCTSCNLDFGWECFGEPSVCSPICGDGQLMSLEDCDDGNPTAGDGCSDSCTTEPGYVCEGVPSDCYGECGNGGMTPDEGCDDGNLTDGDGCAADCTVEPGYVCEGMPSVCETVCGDGVTAGTEGCDDAGESSSCDDDCTPAICGDSTLNVTAGEECDTAGASATCDGDCTVPVCGDNTYNPTAGEGCDDGNIATGDGCDDTCSVEYGYECSGSPSVCNVDCGDGIVYGGEQCDDAGESASCDDDCTFQSCGDGNHNVAAGETCDDGNNTSGDGCDATCHIEFVCGDAVCDTVNGESCQLCPADCCPSCGNNLLQTGLGEECDGTDQGGLTCADFCYTGGTLGCTSWCTRDLTSCTGTLPLCGNAITECGEQCDGADLGGNTCTSLGFSGGTLGCNVGTCQYDFSQCGPAVLSCKAILDQSPGSPDGVYTVDPDGPGPNASVQVYCDMTTDSGGWTLVAATAGSTLNDEASIYYTDLQTLTPAAAHTGIWDGLRAVITGNSDIRFTCKANLTDTTMAVDLSFYDTPWYRTITTGTDTQSCFNESNGSGDTGPHDRRNNITNAFLPFTDAYVAGYMESEDSCSDTNDFTVDFDDRGMDSNQSDGTDWGEDDSTMKCGTSPGGAAWFIFVREP